MATSTADATSATPGSTNGMTPAQALQAKHDALEKAKHIPAEFHKATVEEIVDDEDRVAAVKATPVTDAEPKAMSETSKGKQKAQGTPVKKSAPNDTKSEEALPAQRGLKWIAISRNPSLVRHLDASVWHSHSGLTKHPRRATQKCPDEDVSSCSSHRGVDSDCLRDR